VKFLRSFLAASVLMGLVCGCGKPASPPPPNFLPPEPTQAQPRLPAIKLFVGPAEITAEIASSAREIRRA